MPDTNCSRDEFFILPILGSRFRLKSVLGAVFVAFLISLVIFGSHLFDSSVPGTEDVRAHVFKIDYLSANIAQGNWPIWNQYWYAGIPFDPFYPPGFYTLGALLSFVVQSPVVSYKLILFFTLAFNGIAIFYFSRKLLKASFRSALRCLIAYEACTPLLINYIYGTGPNLLGWNLSAWFLIVYIGKVQEGRTRKIVDVLAPGLLFGMTMLIHPFPAMFALLAVLTYQIVRKVHDWKVPLGQDISYFIKVGFLSSLIGSYYWLPAALNFRYTSPIYTFTKDAWPGGVPYLLIFILVALVVSIFLRKISPQPVNHQFVIACLGLSAFLGFGGTQFVPFGLSSLLHEFRFATIMAPCFAILALCPLLETTKISISVRSFLKPAIYAMCLIMFGCFLSYLVLLSKTSLFELAMFAATVFIPVYLLLLLAMGGQQKKNDDNNSTINPKFISGILVILFTTVIPLSSTWSRSHIERLFEYVNYYEEPDYLNIIDKIEAGRLIVPISLGAMLEGDSIVTFGWRWGVETMNGPFNQGDPKFFDYTVHLEWEERWLEHHIPRQNLMMEGGAKYVFTRAQASLSNPGGLNIVEANDYGSLNELELDVSYAARVTPVLLDVRFPQAVTELFNILLPNGYKMVFVDSNKLDNSLKGLFDTVLIDDPAKAAEYQGKSILLLIDSSTAISVEQVGDAVQITAPVTSLTDRVFYHGDKGNVHDWVAFDKELPSQTFEETLSVVAQLGDAMTSVMKNIEYEKADSTQLNDKIEITTKAGFTLIKSSYFPFWGGSGCEIMATTQGFTLVHSDKEIIVLTYKQPAYYKICAIVTLGSIFGVVLTLSLFAFISKPRAVHHFGHHPQ
jgi:hypothetical protein